MSRHNLLDIDPNSKYSTAAAVVVVAPNDHISLPPDISEHRINYSSIKPDLSNQRSAAITTHNHNVVMPTAQMIYNLIEDETDANSNHQLLMPLQEYHQHQQQQSRIKTQQSVDNDNQTSKSGQLASYDRTDEGNVLIYESQSRLAEIIDGGATAGGVMMDNNEPIPLSRLNKSKVTLNKNLEENLVDPYRGDGFRAAAASNQHQQQQSRIKTQQSVDNDNQTSKSGQLASYDRTDEGNVLIYESQSRLAEIIDGGATAGGVMMDNNEPIPLSRLNKSKVTLNKNLKENLVDPYRGDGFRAAATSNQMPQKNFVKESAGHPDFPQYNRNGYISRSIKTTNSSGSSFRKFSQPQQVYLSHQDTIETDECCHPNFLKSQNMYYSQGYDISDQKLLEGVQILSGNSNKTHFNTENNKMNDFNGSKVLVSCDVNPKEAILIQQPEICDSSMFNHLPDMYIPNFVQPSSTDFVAENGVATDCVYPNNFYGQSFPINDTQKHPLYFSQQLHGIPISNINPNYRNMNAYIVPMVVNCSDKTKHRSSTLPEVKIPDVPECFIPKSDLQETPYLFLTPEPNESHQKHQQFSSNNEQNQINNYSSMPPNDVMNANFPTKQSCLLESSQQNHVNQPESILDQPIVNTISNDCYPSQSSKMIGKFMVTPANVNNESKEVFKSTENIINHNPDINNDASELIPKLERPKQHSRFKKTRIEETIDRWCISGLYSYDRRVKIIPPDVQKMYQSKPEYLSREMDISHNCAKCDNHDREKYCQDVNYHKKEFKFWHNGNHIDLCSELEEDVENYCQFHAKTLKLLNQNQNLSLSKYSSNSCEFNENTNISSPQIFQTVLISSPEHENYIINIDTQSSHVLLSAPPVSPSLMNTASIANLPTSIQSPRSATAKVMLKRATPAVFSNAARSTPLLNESIAIEKIAHGTPTKQDISLNISNLCGPRLLTNETKPLIDFRTPGPSISDQMAFKFASPTYVAGTVIAESPNIDGQLYHHQQSIYSLDRMSSIYYPVYHSVPSISSTTITNKYGNYNSPLINPEDLNPSEVSSTGFSEEVANCTDKFKSIMINIFVKEQNKLLKEIKQLKETNDNLTVELNNMRNRSEKLESLLKEKYGSSEEFCLTESAGRFEQSPAIINRSPKLSPDIQRPDFDGLI